MLCRSKPYNGTEPYLFFSYCHKNADQIYPIIEQMTMDGYRIWYDDGIHPGDDWLEVIAEHLTRSSGCIAAITPESAASHNCRSEINLCMELNKPIVSVLLKDFELSLATRLQLGATQYVRKFDYANDKAFYEKLYSASVLSECRGAPVQLPSNPPEQAHLQADEDRHRKELEEKERIRKIKEEHERIQIQQKAQEAEASRIAREKELEELKHKVEEEEKRKAEEARKKAEEAARLARERELEELRRKVEEEKRKAEEARKKAEEAARLARKRELEELKRKVEEEEKRKAEEARKKAEEAARLAQERELDELRSKLNALLEKNTSPENAAANTEQEADATTIIVLDDSELTVTEYEDSELTVADYGDSERTVVEKDAEEHTIIEKRIQSTILVHLESATFYPIHSAKTSIGRSSVSCDIVFPDDHGMSRHHADIIHLHGKSYLRDMKSGNGTFVNNIQLEAGATVPLDNASWIQLHNVGLLYLTDTLAARVCKEKRISILQNKKDNTCIYLTDEDLVLHRTKTSGRGCFTDDHKISREKHAMVCLRKDSIYVKDLHSKNGTYIDERKLDPQTDYPLRNGANLRIGDTILHCVDLQLKEGDI